VWGTGDIFELQRRLETLHKLKTDFGEKAVRSEPCEVISAKPTLHRLSCVGYTEKRPSYPSLLSLCRQLGQARPRR
jgi:hypothetical protein